VLDSLAISRLLPLPSPLRWPSPLAQLDKPAPESGLSANLLEQTWLARQDSKLLDFLAVLAEPDGHDLSVSPLAWYDQVLEAEQHKVAPSVRLGVRPEPRENALGVKARVHRRRHGWTGASAAGGP
jgi:hypothetical protein